MKWRVWGNRGEQPRTSVVVEAPDARTAAGAAEEMGLGVVSVEIDGQRDTRVVDALAPAVAPAEQRVPVLIERTAKRWKAMLAISVILLGTGLIGAAVIVARHPRAIGDWPAELIVALAIGGLGLVGLVWARLGAWWHHG